MHPVFDTRMDAGHDVSRILRLHATKGAEHNQIIHFEVISYSIETHLMLVRAIAL